MKDRPEISIVMPVYNGERYLREAVESIIAQDFEEWELILVNDCSTDGTSAVMEEYQSRDGRIRVIHNETNQKLPRSLNIGFTQARGNYFTWTSDDNRYKPQALEKMYRYLELHQDTGLVFADMDYIDETGAKTGAVSRNAEEIWSSNCVGACFLYRREVAETVGGYDADLFLVEDYDYWLRIAKCCPVVHLPQCLYEYRNHGTSLTQTRAENIERQLYRLRCRELDVLLSHAGEREKESLFIGMWRQDEQRKDWLEKKFFGEKGLPQSLRWIERKKTMDENKKIILFGAGAFGSKALDYFGEDRVAYYADNNVAMVGSQVNGKEVVSFEQMKEMGDAYQIVISVDARKIPALAAQLEENGMTEYAAYLELVNHLKKPSNGAVSWLETCEKAERWIKENSVQDGGIINNSSLRKSYQEVTGYYIPTLLKWGFSGLAVSYAEWLCSIQHADGAWYDTEGKDPYVFDTAQILKGLLAVRDRVAEADNAIIKGCNWLLSNIEESGRLMTPSKGEWGEAGICSELIHLYCLSPLYEAAETFGESKYREAAEKVADYYVREHGEEIRTFGFLSHFYAYVMEALCDIGREELARESMKQIERFLDEKGYVPAYRDVDWVCSTGMFQLAIVWFKLGDLERGNKALAYAARLQNESGGWYGSYPVTDAPKASDRRAYPDYFADAEISWVVKYFLDAVYWKNKLEFEGQAPVFSDSIARDDGRYRLVLSEILEKKAEKICDVGCGKGRYLKNLMEEMPAASYCAVDISKSVMQEIKPPVEKKEGTLTQIPYADSTFDLVYTVEALEHSIFPENALKELLRVTKPGGEVVVVDKNKAAMGLLEIDEWEQWFADELFERVADEENAVLRIVENVPYEDGIADGLFNAWILKKDKRAVEKLQN